MEGSRFPITAVVITKNEEQNIVRCLKSLEFCDECIVVDSFSSDRTIEIAQSLGARVVQREWDGYTNQKNFANSLATHEWILSVDADEEISGELSREIRTAVESSAAQAYSVPRKTMHFGRWIRHGGWYPNRVVRLFNRAMGEWRGDEVHERWASRGSTAALENPLIHHSFVNFSDQIQRNDLYSSLAARKMRREGVRFSAWSLCVRPCVKFIETYILKGGFLDGWPGLFISVSAAYAVFLKWAKLWEFQRVKPNERG